MKGVRQEQPKHHRLHTDRFHHHRLVGKQGIERVAKSRVTDTDKLESVPWRSLCLGLSVMKQTIGAQKSPQSREWLLWLKSSLGTCINAQGLQLEVVIVTVVEFHDGGGR